MASRVTRVVVLSLAVGGVLFGTRALSMPDPRDEWRTMITGHAVVYSELPDQDTKRIVGRLRDFQRDVFAPGRGIPLSESGLTTDIFLFRKASHLAEYETYGWDAWYQWAPTTSCLLLHQEHWEDAVPIALSMQCLALLRQTYTRIPPWAARGLSEFYSTYRRGGSQVHVGDDRPDLRRTLREADLLPWSRVYEIVDTAPEMHGRGLVVFTAQAWLLVHYLVVGTSHSEADVALYLAHLEAGSDTDAAFHEVFGFPVAEIETRMNEYRKRASISGVTFPAPAGVQEDEGRLVPLSHPLALARLGEMAGTLDAGADSEAATQRHAHARELLAAAQSIEPQLAAAERGLGAVALDAGEVEAAVDHLHQAVAGDSTDVRARLLLAEAILARYRNRRIPFSSRFSKQLAPDIEEARAQLRAVMLARHDFVEPHVLAGKSYLYDPGDAGPGLSMLASILRMFPGRSDIRESVVFLALKKGDVALALDTGLAGRIDDPQTEHDVAVAVDEGLRQAVEARAKDPARAREIVGAILARLDRRALTDSQQATLAEVER